MQKRWISRTTIATNNNSNTYYDSQSGQHVPIHNEYEVSVYLRGIGDCSTQKVIDATKQYGVSGSLLTLTEQMNGNIVNDTPISRNDNIYLHIKPEICFDKHQNEMSFPKGYNPSFEYKVGNDDTIIRTIKQYKRDVSIGIFNSNIIMDEDPISVAASVANIIDCTSATLDENETSITPYISNIIIAPSTDDSNTIDTTHADNLVRLCEELSYLDVPGPTIKSRLIVSTLNNNEEVIEECLHIGINKYVLDISDNVDNDLDDRLMSLRKVVEEEGKELVLSDE